MEAFLDDLITGPPPQLGVLSPTRRPLGVFSRLDGLTYQSAPS